VARVRRDLIDDSEAPTSEEVWAYKEVAAVAKRIAKNGSVTPKQPEKAIGPAKFATALATLRTVDEMADLGLRVNELPAGNALAKAAEFLLKSQGDDGALADLILGETPSARGKTVALHFQGWALGALCRIGYDNDPRVDEGLKFLLAGRQNDGGWAWRGVRTDSAARPSSHLVTGMVLRAFAASPRKTSREARRAAELLATRFLQPDRYPDRKAPNHWELIAEPRFYIDVLDALDSVTAVGLGKENSGVRTAEAYLRGRQMDEGLWYPGPPGKVVAKTLAPKDKEAALWLTLRVLLALRRIN
jgi:hypothetical protein